MAEGTSAVWTGKVFSPESPIELEGIGVNTVNNCINRRLWFRSVHGHTRTLHASVLCASCSVHLLTCPTTTTSFSALLAANSILTLENTILVESQALPIANWSSPGAFLRLPGIFTMAPNSSLYLVNVRLHIRCTHMTQLWSQMCTSTKPQVADMQVPMRSDSRIWIPR